MSRIKPRAEDHQVVLLQGVAEGGKMAEEKRRLQAEIVWGGRSGEWEMQLATALHFTSIP
jgi:hypothetical protein